jgi:cytolethal distending toxin subunit A
VERIMTNSPRLAAALFAGTVAAATASFAPDAAAQDIMLVNGKTGKCLTIAGGTLSDNNIPTVQFDCDGDPSRRWRMKQTGGGRYQFSNVKTAKCLTIAGGVSRDNNVTALQYECDSDPSRTWQLTEPVGGGSYKIRNVQTGKCLTIAGGTLADNNIEGVQYDCDDDPSRRWTIRTVAGTSPQPAPAYQTSNWSGWARTAGIAYRYRSGWSPQDSKYIDAIFEIRNAQAQVWHGAARSLDCVSDTLSRGTNIDVQASQTRVVTFKTANCGSPNSPAFRPNVVQSSTF